MSKMTSVWIVRHTHKHGENLYVHSTRKGAMDRRDLIVKDNTEDFDDEIDFIEVFSETVDE